MSVQTPPAAPSPVPTPATGPQQLIPVPDARQRATIDRAVAALDPALVRDLVVGMVAIPSPPGEERPLATWLVEQMTGLGLEANLQVLDDHQANAVGRLSGARPGRELLLYAPIDTFSTGVEEEDVPAVASRLRPDMRPEPRLDGHVVTGLGASNPKGHGAAIVAAVAALRASGAAFDGTIAVGLCGGGMPTNGRPTGTARRQSIAQGSGCTFYLDHGGWADEAIICKPGWAVHWEEVGLVWGEVVVHGSYGYVGSRHRIAYANPIVAASTLVARLDRWFAAYTARWTDGLVAPQGNIGSIQGGLPHLQSMTPAECRIRFDLRTSPRASLGQVRREIDAAVQAIAAEEHLDVTCRTVLTIPGSRTDPDAHVVRSTIGAWEDLEGRPHEPITGNSGATDANVLRRHGIPVARIGMPKIGPDANGSADFARGMNAVDLREVHRLAELLVRAVVLGAAPDGRPQGGAA